MRSNRGAMEISVGWFLILVMCLAIFFIGPVIFMMNHRENTVVAQGQAIIDNVVQEVAVTGKLTQEMVDRCEESLNSLGEVWDLQITIQRKDDNPLVKSAKMTTADGTVYIVDYDTNVRDDLASKNVITLRTDDQILLTATIHKDTVGSGFIGVQGSEQGNRTIQSSAKVSAN